MSVEYINYEEKFENELIAALEEKGLEYRFTCYGIEFKTQMDTWVVDVREAFENEAHVIMYHKDPIHIQNYKKRRGGIEGYHIQFSKRMDVSFIMGYTLTHARKFKAKRNHK